MKHGLDYIKLNKQAWNEKTPYHLDSEFYDVDGFLKGKSSLNDIELGLLGDISGKSILHLQCHFGQDTISLGRMGAQTTGIDLSDKAIEVAVNLAKESGVNTRFICCDIYDLPNHLNEQFDIVFTSYGTIGWLPDIDRWARIVSKYLKPKGKFVFAEFHPIVWMFDDDFSEIKYDYLKSDAIVEIEEGTYADKEATVSHKTVTWNHGISEVVNSLIANDLEINKLNEYNYSPYDCFNKTEKIGPHRFRIKHLGKKIPMVYAILATKKDSE